MKGYASTLYVKNSYNRWEVIEDADGFPSYESILAHYWSKRSLKGKKIKLKIVKPSIRYGCQRFAPEVIQL